MDNYPKDSKLTNIYVKRCKCGARPYSDRTPIGCPSHWIVCNCGRVGKSSLSKQEAIDNWNKDLLEY